MSYRNNILFSYASRFINAVLAVVVIPIYVSIFGLSEYGVIGFYLLLLSLSQFLDIGLSSTFSREIALSKDDRLRRTVVATNLKFVLLVFFVVSIFIAMTFYFNSEYIVYDWLDTNDLDQKNIVVSVSFIGFILSIKLMSGPIRSIFVGFQKLVALHKINIIFSLLRYLGVLPVLSISNNHLITYFTFQLFISVLEFVVLVVLSLRYFDYLKPKVTLRCIIENKSLYVFAFKVAISSWLWIAISQVDKVLLSKNLTIESFSIFTMAMTITSSLLLFSTPLSQAILPKLAQEFKLDKTKYYETFDLSIRKLFNYISFVPVYLYFFYQEIVYSWIGNVKVVNELSVYLPNYIISTAIVMVINCFYLLQHSQGDISWHNRMHACLFTFFIILMPIYVESGGVLYISTIWLVGVVVYMIFGGKVVFEKFHKSKFMMWLLTHVVVQFVISYLIVNLIYKVNAMLISIEINSRLEVILSLMVSFCISAIISIFFNKKIFDLIAQDSYN